MTRKITAVEPHVEKFQQLLRELFQFDCADLDFGIYRIMNHKRDVIEKFITEKLPNALVAELDRGPLFQQTQAADALEQVGQKVRNTLGDTAFDSSGDLDATWHNTPVGKEYLEAKSLVADGGRSWASTEAQIYNHLYSFFSRYYQDGDFISKRRYSRRERYAIPYNGEEVYLHWANSDQYYIKTAEHFQDYDWKAANGVTVRFKVQAADVEQNNVKGDKRFFLPLASETSWDEEQGQIIIPFEYRPLTPQKTNKHGNQNQQDKIIAEAVATIPKLLEKATPAYTALTNERRRNGNGPVSNLEHHLRQYTRRNTSDFFIHKDLKGFLSRELDFYLKNEVLNLDEMERAGEQMAEGWFQMMRLIKSVGNPIIDFLEQIENFQKMLWEKRKFVTETQYCIAVGSIDPGFYPAIADNQAQWAEWRELFDIDDSETTLFNVEHDGTTRRVILLQSCPTLVMDTKHFDQEFVSKLLASFDDLDGMTDGLLIHSENWQALNLLHDKYNGKINCVYIDPPYNTDASAILYKNDYKDSSWLSLMENRLSISSTLMSKAGVLCCAIDDEEVALLRLSIRSAFVKELGIVPVRSNPAGRKSKGQFSPSHEYALFFGNSDAVPGTLNKTEKELARYPLVDSKGRFAWNNLVRHGSGDMRQDRPKLFYPIYVNNNDRIRIPNMEWDENKQEYKVMEKTRHDEIAVYPVRVQDGATVEKRWHRGHEAVKSNPSEYRIRRGRETNDSGTEISIDFKIRIDMDSMPKTWWDDTRYASANLGAKTLKDIFIEKSFDFVKAIGLVEDCLRASFCDSRSIVLDYFAGSGTTGHAVINLNREDGGKRKFILVEMGEYFDTVLLPRIKKVTFTPEWKAGKPQRMTTQEEAERSPRIVKYIRLESYEDALNNIEFDAATEQLALEEKYEDYLLRYMLRWETKGSGTLLNVEKLTSPCIYKLKLHIDGEPRVKTVDVPETFNYLVGPQCANTPGVRG